MNHIEGNDIMKWAGNLERVAVMAVAPARKYVFTVDLDQLASLTKAQAVYGVARPRGRQELQYVVLKVTVAKAKQILHIRSTPTLSSSVVSIKKQDRGAKRWIQRTERTRSGRMGGMKSMIVRLNQDDTGHLDATREAVKP